MLGVNGKILRVDLTKSRIYEEKIPESIFRKYLTGYGLGSYILNRDMKPHADPLGPENILGVTTGVFNGHAVPLGGRFQVVAKSPITGGWGDANCGGKFGPELKNARYDAVFIQGISEKPVFLKIIDGKASIEDARHIWGKDAYQAEEELKRIDPKGQALVIGVPGEKMLNVASLMNDFGRAAGRSGLGAVMGSKKLKGIFVRGTTKVPAADPQLLTQTIKDIQILFRKNIDLARPWQLFGTTGSTESSHLNGDTPIKNWAGVGLDDFGAENARKISGEEIRKDKIRSYGCSQCTLACGGHVKRSTKYGEIDGHRLEYEGTGSFGGLNLVSDLDAMSMAFEVCNRAGMDIISVGAAIAFANECFERGVLTKKDIGFEIGFRNPDAMVRLTEMIGRGEGIGKILGMGTKYAASVFGKGSSSYAVNIEGQDLPMHDPKLLPSLATTYLADPSPGRHTAGGIGFDEGGELTLPFEYDFTNRKIERYKYHGKGKMQALSVYGAQVLNATGMCLFSTSVWPNSYPYSKLLKAIMGWDVDSEELMTIGRRIQVLRHLFNYREGINPSKIIPPPRMIGNPPLKSGPTSGVTLDYKTMVTEYLEEVGIDQNGKPLQNAVDELGIEI
ncbi:MAG: aldehyde ferredoxin oxidoreductase family protein [Thermoplasmataceae archaeon]